MIIIDAVNLIINVDSERNAIQTFVAHTTPETTRMVRFAHGLQYLKGKHIRHAASILYFTNHFHDEVSANGALFRRLLESRVLR